MYEYAIFSTNSNALQQTNIQYYVFYLVICNHVLQSPLQHLVAQLLNHVMWYIEYLVSSNSKLVMNKEGKMKE